MARVTEVSYKISDVATPLCPRTSAGIGLSIDYLQAYNAPDREAIAALLNMSGLPQVAAVAPTSPADIANIQAGDDIIAIAGTPIADLLARSADPSLFADELEQYLAALPADKPFTMQINRKGQAIETQVNPHPICAARFIIDTNGGISAHSDAINVSISSKLIQYSQNDDELALIAGHELGHVINQDVNISGLRQRRNAEDQADIVGLRLIFCAGYNTEKALQFWLRRDSEDWLSLLRSPTHRSRKTRVELMRAEAANLTCPLRKS